MRQPRGGRSSGRGDDGTPMPGSGGSDYTTPKLEPLHAKIYLLTYVSPPNTYCSTGVGRVARELIQLTGAPAEVGLVSLSAA